MVKNKIFYLLLIFYAFRFTSAKINYDLLVADNQEAVCFFQNYNQNRPEAFPKISAPHSKECGKRKFSLRSIYSSPQFTHFELFGADNIVDLLYTRIGNFELEWKTMEEAMRAGTLDGVICENYLKELLTEFKYRKHGHTRINIEGKSLCLYDDIFADGSEKSCQKVARHNIHKKDAAYLFNKYNIVVQPGAGICDTHWAQIREEIDGKAPSLQPIIEADEIDDNEVSDHSFEGMDDDFDPGNEIDSEKEKERCENLRTFGKSLGIESIETLNNYNTLSDRQKRTKVSAARLFLSFIFKVMAPDAEKEFGKKVCSNYNEKEKPNTQRDELKDAYAEQYLKSDDKRLRKIILGPMAAKCTYAEVFEKIPGLSYFLYGQARECYKAAELPEDIPKTFKRYDKKKIRTFMEFFTSPHCMVILPYGENKVKLTNGEKLDIAANIRLQSHAQIVRMYERMMREEGREEEILPKSTMFAMLQYCHAKQSKALTCVDYFQAAAVDGFDEVKVILKEWESTGTINLQQSGDLQTRFKATQQYLQTDFSVSLESDSSVISYCFQHALSDPNDADLSATCDADHVTVSPRCTAMSKTMEDLEKLSDELISICKEENCAELEDLEIKNARIQNALFHIMELKRHIVRSRWSDLERSTDIANLNEKTAYLTLDWAQKLLRTKFWETQSEYFGKEGMAHHITHVQTKINGASVEHAYIHIIEENKQDASAVIAIILDVLLNLKQKGIESVILRSDNAGCYHNKELILSIAKIIEQSGVKISKYSFSEPQNGKSDSDRIAALVKKKVRTYVNEKKGKVEDEKQFYDALVDFPGMTYASISVSTVNRQTIPKIPTIALKGISKYYTFTFQPNGVLVHRAANIGKGKFFKYSRINIKLEDIPDLTISKEHNAIKNQDDIYWRPPTKKTKKPQSHNSNFECFEATCDATFDTYEEFMTHVMSGEHCINPQRLLQKDFVVLLYRDLTDQRAPVAVDKVARAFEEGGNAENLIENAYEYVPPIGWAHRHFQTNPKITDEKRKFVYEKFLEGAKNKAKKWSPKNIIHAMLLAKKMENAYLQLMKF